MLKLQRSPVHELDEDFGDRRNNPIEIFSNDPSIIRFVVKAHRALNSASLNSEQKAT